MSVRLKICGINTIESMYASKKAEFIGLVFYPKSPRFVNIETAKKLIKYSPDQQKKVGLFVNTDFNVMQYICDNIKLDYIQLHGEESIEKIKKIKKKINLPIIKSIKISSNKDLEYVAPFSKICDIILFDTMPQDKNMPGGNGKKFDWNILKNYKTNKEWMLAGGINIKNIKKAIQITNAPIIDISSGLEKKKGVKSISKIKEFIKLASKKDIKNG